MANVLTYNELLTGGGGISRRKFIKGVGAAVAGGALLAIAGRTLLSALSQVPGSALMRSTFAGHVGDVFQVYQGSAATLALRLADVRDLPAPARKQEPASDQQERSFSLLFTGPADLMIAQGTYRFEHHEIGAFSMFIVPMAPAKGARYEAIFNRLPR